MDSGRHAEIQRPSILRRFFSFVVMVVVVLGCAFLIRTYVCEPFEVPSASMEETIMTGDYIFAEKVSYQFGEPQQGDIAVFADPQIPSRTLVKRVIATEGQTINLIDGKVYIDGVELTEAYTSGQPTYPLSTAGNVSISYPYTIPEGYVWMMGDNRTNSLDSRYFGPIDEDTLFGKAILIYWPLNEIGLLN